MAEREDDTTIQNCSCVLPIIFRFLSSQDLLRAQRTCKEWRVELTPPSAAATWFYQSLLISRWPWAVTPPFTLDAKSTSAETMREIYIVRRHLMEHLLPSVWSDEDFRESCKFGKYSRWALDEQFDDGQVLIDLAWVVRLMYCLGPEAYLILDGADTSVYNPEYSMQASDSPGWWLYKREDYWTVTKPKLLFERDSYVALEVLDRSTGYYSKHKNTAMPVIGQILEEKRDFELENNKNWNRAMDIVEHTKLLSFLLLNSRSLLALLWDADGVACRGVENLSQARFKCWGLEKRCAFGVPHPRQIPHLFNMVKLGQHVEALSWNACCTKSRKREND